MIICEVCDEEIGEGQSLCHKVIGWVAVKQGKQTSALTRSSAPIGYAHKICLEGGESRTQVGLFD